jgi:HAD superfamily hydrolase (TIGR01509 family)
MLSDVDAVLFDFDGTLIDSSEPICLSFNEALTRHGLKPLADDSIKAAIGRPLRDLFGEQGEQVPVDDLVEEYKRAFAELAPGRAFLMPGVRELISALSRQKKLGVVTSRTSTGTAQILEDLGLFDCFSILVGIEDVEQPKPSPDPVLFALRKLAVLAQNSVFIGDTTYDMEAGRSAGTKTIGVTSGSHNREQLLAAGADFVVNDLITLQNMLRD